MKPIKTNKNCLNVKCFYSSTALKTAEEIIKDSFIYFLKNKLSKK